MRLVFGLLMIIPCLMFAENYHMPQIIQPMLEGESIINVFGTQNSVGPDKDKVTNTLGHKITGFLQSPFENKSEIIIEGVTFHPGDTIEIKLGSDQFVSVSFIGINSGNALFKIDEDMLEVSLQKDSRVVVEPIIGIGVFVSQDGWILASLHDLQGLEKTPLKIYWHGMEFPCQLLETDMQTELALLKALPIGNIQFPCHALAETIENGEALWSQEREQKKDPLKHVFYKDGELSHELILEIDDCVFNAKGNIAFYKTPKGLIKCDDVLLLFKNFQFNGQTNTSSTPDRVKIFKGNE